MIKTRTRSKQLLLPMLLLAMSCKAQTPIPYTKALKTMIENYPGLKAARLRQKASKTMEKSAWNWGNTDLSTGADEVGHGEKGTRTIFGIHQEIDILGMCATKKFLQTQTDKASIETEQAKRTFIKEMSMDYANCYIMKRKYDLLKSFETTYNDLMESAKKEYEKDSIPEFEYIAAQSEAKLFDIKLMQAKDDWLIACRNLSRWLAEDTLYMADKALDSIPEMSSTAGFRSIEAEIAKQEENIAKAEMRTIKTEGMPKFFVEMGSQSVEGRKGFCTWQVGFSLPLNRMAQHAKTKAARIRKEAARQAYLSIEKEEQNKKHQLMAEEKKWKETAEYYLNTALPLAKKQLDNTIKTYKSGATDYMEIIQSLKSVISSELDFLDIYEKYLQTSYTIDYYQQ